MTVRRLSVLLAVLVLASAALTGWLATRSEPSGTEPGVTDDGSYTVGTIPDDDGQLAVLAAAETIPLALTYDYRSLDEGLTDAMSHMTSSFAAEFEDTFRKTAAELATEKKAVTRALVRAAGLVEAKEGSATCLVYVDQVLVSSAGQKDDKPVRVSQNRVVVTLTLEGDEWKVDGIEPF